MSQFTVLPIYWPQQIKIANLRRQFGRARALANYTKLGSGDLARTLSDLVVTVRAFERLGIQKGLFTAEELQTALREAVAEESSAPEAPPASTRDEARPLRRRLRARTREKS